jgi:hypothetical protein
MVLNSIGWNDQIHYNITVTGQSSYGIIEVDIIAGTCVDRFGNPNAASTAIDNTVEYGKAHFRSFIQ